LDISIFHGNIENGSKNQLTTMESKLEFDFKTTQKIIKKISVIDSFKGKWVGLEGKESKYLKELKKIASIESIGSSTRIEGSTLTNEEVADLLSSIKISEFKTRDEQEVFGYYEVLNLIIDSFTEIDLKENHISHLHKLLLSKSTKDEHHRGQYKKLSNKVVANYPGGRQKVIFNTTEPYLVKEEMIELLKWTNQHLEEETIHPLIVIATFIYEFLSIHPFQDGNGRLSRLLTTLILLQNNYDFIQFTSMELEIEKRKKDYYNALMDGQKNRYKKSEKIDKWLLFFLETLEQTIIKLENRYEYIKEKKSYLNDRQKKLFGFIKENEPVKINDVIESMTSYKSYTLKKDMAYLTSEGMIQRIGKARATIYIVSEKTKNFPTPKPK